MSNRLLSAHAAARTTLFDGFLHDLLNGASAKGSARILGKLAQPMRITRGSVAPLAPGRDALAHAPDQAVLVDLANRRFYMFGIEIWPHEFYFVAGLLIMAGIGLFLVTSAVGRAWCGYACPQKVWTDLFQHVDRFVGGDRNVRMRLDKAQWGAGKVARRSFKWAIYLFVSFWTGGAWIMYFADAPMLTVDFWTGNAAAVAYITVAVLTAMTFILGGFLREQVCIYMCPWPRIQSAMLDEKSLLVTYKDWRGEQRGSVKKADKNPGNMATASIATNVLPYAPPGSTSAKGRKSDV